MLFRDSSRLGVGLIVAAAISMGVSAWSSAWLTHSEAGGRANVGVRKMEFCVVGRCQSLAHSEYQQAMRRLGEAMADPAIRSRVQNQLARQVGGSAGVAQLAGDELGQLAQAQTAADTDRWNTYRNVAFWGGMGVALLLLFLASTASAGVGKASAILGGLGCVAVGASALGFLSKIPDGYLPHTEEFVWSIGYAGYACLAGAALGVVGCVLAATADSSESWQVSAGSWQAGAKPQPTGRAPSCPDCGRTGSWRQDVGIYICDQCGLAV